MEDDPRCPGRVEEDGLTSGAGHSGPGRQDRLRCQIGAGAFGAPTGRHTDGVVGAVPVVPRVEEEVPSGGEDEVRCLDHPGLPRLVRRQQLRGCARGEAGAGRSELLRTRSWQDGLLHRSTSTAGTASRWHRRRGMDRSIRSDSSDTRAGRPSCRRMVPRRSSRSPPKCTLRLSAPPASPRSTARRSRPPGAPMVPRSLRVRPTRADWVTRCPLRSNGPGRLIR